MRLPSRFHLRLSLAAVVLVATFASVLAPPASAAGKQEGTIALPASDLAQAFGAGTSNAGEFPVGMACPEPGELDGVVYKFFDLKGEFKKIKASGPKILFAQDTPAGNFNDYDLDLFVFDSKCNLQPSSGTKNAGGASETASPRKPARYAVIAYWAGPYPNIAVTLEYS